MKPGEPGYTDNFTQRVNNRMKTSTLSQEILSLTREAMSAADAKFQAQALMGYLSKFNDPDEQAEAGAKWMDSKDFSPEDKAAIFKEYDKLIQGKKFVDSMEIDAFGEAVRPSQAADDAETALLAKLVVEQQKLLEEVKKHSSYMLDAARNYNKFLEKNEVQAMLSQKATSLGNMISSNCEEVMEIV